MIAHAALRLFWLLVWNMFFSPSVGNAIIPIDFHIFQRRGLKPPTSVSTINGDSPWFTLIYHDQTSSSSLFTIKPSFSYGFPMVFLSSRGSWGSAALPAAVMARCAIPFPNCCALPLGSPGSRSSPFFEGLPAGNLWHNHGKWPFILDFHGFSHEKI